MSSKGIPDDVRNARDNAPYDFVPIPSDENHDLTEATLLAPPMTHDGTGAQDTLTGELRCTLVTRTPTIVANDQLEAAWITGATARGRESYRLPNDWGLGNLEVPAKKKIIEPLILENDRVAPGRVVISGTAIKGMIRQSVGALLSAPMERVGERSYSYRPNLDSYRPNLDPRVDANQLRDVRPAIVTALDGRGRPKGVAVLEDPLAIYFVHSRAFDALSRRIPALAPGHHINGTIDGVELVEENMPRRPPRRRLIAGGAGETLDHYYYTYRGGIDGTGRLAHAFSRVRGAFRSCSTTYCGVIVPRRIVSGALPLPVAVSVRHHYNRTQQHLADRNDGHLRDEHPLARFARDWFAAVSRDIRLNEPMELDQLIYVELQTHVDRAVVCSFGHNFGYRWRYTDTVREVLRRVDGRRLPFIRGIVAPSETERAVRPGTDQPEQLTGARVIFGYVSENNECSGVDSIGRGDFTRWAGRVAVNAAVEVVDHDDTAKRFLRADRGFAVPLKVLGLPRSSAVEMYLEQDGGISRTDGANLVTYGDLVGDDPGGKLRGRKFYPHQPAAAASPALYEDLEGIVNDQSAIARFVSAPNRPFKFTIRFRHLRLWELGAVVCALCPDLLAKAWGLNTAAASPDSPAYAVKLGHGRPLGMGSVEVGIDAAVTVDPTRAECEQMADIEAAVAAFAERLNEYSDRRRAAEKWLEIHRYAGQPARHYPQQNGTIFGFHTNVRRRHAGLRRLRP